MNLYELTAEYQNALDSIRIDEETGEATGFEAIDGLDAAFEIKAEIYALHIKNLNAMADALDAEKKAIADRQARAKRRADAMREHLAYAMNAVGKDRIETARAALSFRKSTSVQIMDDTIIPENLCTIKTERRPDKTAIGKLLKAGEAVPGAELKKSSNLQVK